MHGRGGELAEPMKHMGFGARSTLRLDPLPPGSSSEYVDSGSVLSARNARGAALSPANSDGLFSCGKDSVNLKSTT